MKRTFILAFALLAMLFSAQDLKAETLSRGNNIEFVVGIIDPTYDPEGIHRSPVKPPLVYLEDGVLTFEVGHPDYALTIKDENDNVVYTTVVTSSQTTVVLPSTLSGNDVIELVMGNWLFTGRIDL